MIVDDRITPCGAQVPFANTLTGVLRYKRFVKWWQKRWTAHVTKHGYGSLEGGHLRKLLDLHELYLTDVVGSAFYRDTHWYNSLEHCLTAVRTPKGEMPMLSKWITDLANHPPIRWEP